MNNPIEPDGNLEQRVEHIEREIKRVRFALDHIKVDTGSSRESFDAIEQKQSEALKLLRGIAQGQADHGEKFDAQRQELHTHAETWLKSLQENFDEVRSALVEIRTTQGSRNERFDHIDTRFDKQDQRMDSMDSKLDQILALLQQKP